MSIAHIQVIKMAEKHENYILRRERKQ